MIFCIGNAFDHARKLANKVWDQIVNKGERADDDFMILSYSLNTGSGKSPLHKFENAIVQLNKNKKPLGGGVIFCKQEEMQDNPDSDGKLLISTIHKSKGLERKHVIIFNFSDFGGNFVARGVAKNDELASLGLMTEPYFGKYIVGGSCIIIPSMLPSLFRNHL